MQYWLAKTEADVYPIDDLKKDRKTSWQGIRNYQARNFLKKMEVGDKVFIYHTVLKPPGIAGLAEISKIAYPDASQFDTKSEYFDEKSSEAEPRWFSPDIKFVKKFNSIIPLDELKKHRELKNMYLFKMGRLSVMPVTKSEYEKIISLVK